MPLFYSKRWGGRHAGTQSLLYHFEDFMTDEECTQMEGSWQTSMVFIVHRFGSGLESLAASGD